MVSDRLPAPMKPLGKERQDYSFSKTCPDLGPQRNNLPLLLSGRKPRAALRYTGCSLQTKMLLHSARRWGREGQQDGQAACELPQPARPWTRAHCLPQYTHLCPAPRTPAGPATAPLSQLRLGEASTCLVVATVHLGVPSPALPEAIGAVLSGCAPRSSRSCAELQGEA